MDKITGKVVRTEADWAVLVDACERASQSAAVFCRGQSVAYSLFLYHRGKIPKNLYRLIFDHLFAQKKDVLQTEIPFPVN